MGEKERNRNTIKSLESATRVLELMKERNGLQVTELADELDVAKSTAHRYLTSLQESEWVVKEGNVYQISFKFMDFGHNSLSRIPCLDLIKERINDLADETDERVQFVVAEHGKGILVYTALGSQAVDINVEMGARIPLHAISPGKAILAEWPQDRVEEYVQTYGLRELTPNTITSRSELHDEIEQIKERGYAVNNQEHLNGIKSVGAAIVVEESNPIGGLSISRPAYRFDEATSTDALHKRITEVATNLELNLRYQE